MRAPQHSSILTFASIEVQGFRGPRRRRSNILREIYEFGGSRAFQQSLTART
jgi:hypothetical protein